MMTNPKTTAEAFQWIIRILRARAIPFQVTGGLAGIAYGSKRELRDIDVDIPEDRIPELVPDVREYITFGPQQMNDGSWDLLLMTLTYKVHEIDLGGAFHARIFDAATKEWRHVPCDIKTAETHELLGQSVNVIHPKDFIWYKRILNRSFEGNRIDEEDAAAADRYLQASKKGMASSA